MPSLGLGLNLYKTQTAVYSGLKLDAQAVAHYDRVIADGGIMPAGLLGCNAWFVAVKAVYAVTDITTAISAGYDPHYLGAKIGAGSGTTLGQAATKLYSCSGASGDLVQATAASMPLLLVKNSTDANYWFGSGVTGNYVQTNSTYTFDSFVNITDFTLNNDSSAEQSIFTYGAYGFNIAFGLTYRKAIDQFNILYYAPTAITASFFYTLSVGVKYSIRTTRNSTSGLLSVELLISGTWTSIYSTIGTSGALSNKANFHIGSSTTSNATNGKIWRSTTYDLSSNVLVDFNPASYNAATSQTQWTSATSEVWTINTGTATTGYKGQIVDYTCLQGDGVDDRLISSSALSVLSSYDQFIAYNAFNNQGTYMFGSSPASGANKDINYWVQLTAGGNMMWQFSDATNFRVGTVSPYNYKTLQLQNNRYSSGDGFLTIKRNNGADLSNTSVSGSATTSSGSQKIGLFSLGEFAGVYSNANFATSIIGSVMTPTQRTAMYNALSSFRGNAF